MNSIVIFMTVCLTAVAHSAVVLPNGIHPIYCPNYPFCAIGDLQENLAARDYFPGQATERQAKSGAFSIIYPPGVDDIWCPDYPFCVDVNRGDAHASERQAKLVDSIARQGNAVVPESQAKLLVPTELDSITDQRNVVREHQAKLVVPTVDSVISSQVTDPEREARIVTYPPGINEIWCPDYPFCSFRDQRNVVVQEHQAKLVFPSVPEAEVLPDRTPKFVESPKVVPTEVTVGVTQERIPKYVISRILDGETIGAVTQPKYVISQIDWADAALPIIHSAN